MSELATINVKSETKITVPYLLKLKQQHEVDIDKFRLQIDDSTSLDGVLIAPKDYLDNKKNPKYGRRVIFYLNDASELYEDIMEKLISLAKLNQCAVYAHNYRNTGLSTGTFRNLDELIDDVIYTMDFHVQSLKEGYQYSNYTLCGKEFSEEIATGVQDYYAVFKSINIKFMEYVEPTPPKQWLPSFNELESKPFFENSRDVFSNIGQELGTNCTIM